MHVYVAAPYMDAPLVRALHQQLTSARFTPTSSWADEATGAEALDALSPAEVRRIAKANDEDLHRAHVLIVLAREGAGAEMFAEARLALEYETAVIWVGARRPLSAYRAGVVRVDTAQQALAKVVEFEGLVDVIRRIWSVDDDGVRDVVWELVGGSSEKEGAHAA